MSLIDGTTYFGASVQSMEDLIAVGPAIDQVRAVMRERHGRRNPPPAPPPAP